MTVLLTVTPAAPPSGQGFTLLDARTEFVKASRRYDLVVDTTTFADAGADRYINNGIRLLDQKVDHPGQFRSQYFQLAVGDFFITPEYLIHPTDIYIIDSDGRNNITKERLTPSGYFKAYPKIVADQDGGTPCNWAIFPAGLSPAQIADTSTTFTSAAHLGFEAVHFLDDALGPDWNFQRILLGPKADAVYTVEITGKFFSRRLLDNSDENFWTVQYPELVIQAGMYMLERNNRNTAGMRAIMEGINEELSDVDNVALEWEFDGFHNRIGEDN